MSGILLVNKPQAITSFGVVARLRKILNLKKIGHSGTLDPNATGVLLVLLDKSTKLLPYLDYQDKTYHFKMKLGIKTDTGDIWGDIIEEQAWKSVSDEQINDVFKSFVGHLKQLPPMYSAVKINGKKLYEYARQDKIIERQTREIEIFDLVLINHTQTELEGVVRCSKGTYIRTLCEDIAAQLNGLATMSYLQRTAIGKLTIDQAYSLEDIESGAYQLLTPKEVLTDYPFIEYANIEDVYNGKPIRLDLDSELVCIEHEHELVAVYEKDKGHIYRCSRGLW